MAAPLELETARLRLVPIVERSMEGKHSIIKLRSQHKRMLSGEHTALTLRLPEAIRRMRVEPDFVKQLTDAFTTCRHPRRMAEAFGLQTHPSIVTFNESLKKHQWDRLYRIISDIMYRTDVATQFKSYNEAQTFNERSFVNATLYSV